jgi:ketosteroid isomerase-like protein
MSRANVELTHQLIDAFNRRDLSTYLALMDPEVEFVPYEVYIEGGEPYRGHAGIRRWWEELFAVIPDVRGEVYEIRDFGRRTLVIGCIRGRGAGSGAPIERSMWLVTEWRDGKEIWWCGFSSEEEALEAASGSELPRATHPDPSDV